MSNTSAAEELHSQVCGGGSDRNGSYGVCLDDIYAPFRESPKENTSNTKSNPKTTEEHFMEEPESMRATQYANIPPTKWIIPDILPTGLTILAGEPKAGKSWLLLDLAYSINTGRPFLDRFPTNVGGTLYLALEDTREYMKERINDFMNGEDAPEAGFVAYDWEQFADKDGDENGCLTHLREWLSRHPEVDAVFIDTFHHLRPERRKIESEYDRDVRHLRNLKRFADELKIAIVITMHTRKADSPNKNDKISGTRGYTGTADLNWILERPDLLRPDGEITMGGRKVKRSFNGKLRFDDLQCRWIWQGEVSGGNQSDERQKMLTVMEQLDRPAGPTELAKLTGKTLASVKMLLPRMVERGLIDKSGGKYFIPEDPDNEELGF